jgi:hypothetical protein
VTAYYGVQVNLGSHADQLAGAPLTYSLLLLPSRGNLACPQRTPNADVYGDALRNQGIDFLLMLQSVPAALTPGSQNFFGFSFDAGSGAAKAVNGAFDTTVLALKNLPTRAEANFGSTGFPQIAGTVTATVASTTVSGWFDNHTFTAEHCPAFDDVVGE